VDSNPPPLTIRSARVTGRVRAMELHCQIKSNDFANQRQNLQTVDELINTIANGYDRVSNNSK
jgi:hypothetical protein